MRQLKQCRVAALWWIIGAVTLCSNATAQNRPVYQYFYDANGNVTSIVDGLNRVTTKNYDALDRLRRITQPPPAALQPNPVIQLEYNGRDDLSKVIDPRNLSTAYGVSGLSAVTTQTSPDTGVTTRTFDAAGNVLTSRDARGRTTTYAYDALHRLTRATYGDATFSTYVYDQGANGVGRLTSMTDPGSITTSWTYTPIGRVATKTQTIGTLSHQLSYSYNPTTGQLISMTYPSGKVISYTYGASSKYLERIVINGINAASAITYHPFGGVKRMTLGNGQVWSNTLDQDGRVRTYTLGAVTYTIAWDAANRITRITSSQTATNQTFGYDNLDRITSFGTTGRSQSFGYDATGNLLAKSDLVGTTQTNYTYSIAATSNRLTGISSMGIGYSFDAAGNRTGDGRITYAYNQRGRLNQVRIINGAITDTYNYLINGVNLRVRKTGPSAVVPTGTQIFVYDDQARLIGEYDNLGRARTEHVWLEERPIAAITYTYSGTSTTPATTTTSYVETDHLGTPRLVTNASKQKRWSWQSAPYGDTFPNENPQSLGVYVYNLRFPGQYFDKETNHHYNHHRDYESTTGRYVQSDPIGLTGGINTYAYVMNDPISYIDPEALAACYVHFPQMPIEYAPGKTSSDLGGHAGVLGYDESGTTRYYEYGRYEPSSPGVIGARRPGDDGNVRRLSVPDLKMGPDGNPTAESWAALLAALSRSAGKGTPAQTTCDQNANEKKVYEYTENIANDKSRAPYAWQPWRANHCRTFAFDAYKAGQK